MLCYKTLKHAQQDRGKASFEFLAVLVHNDGHNRGRQQLHQRAHETNVQILKCFMQSL